MAEKFAGKVVLVAGGTGGLGRAVSLAFLAEGATVAVNYRKQAGFDALQSAAGAGGKNLEGYIAEVTDEAAIGAAVGRIIAKHGRLDALVNSVGG
jgi:NAD(P)-dependent dehydrogenase (short-subunit alcohol dehydrogenase family)